MEVAVGLRRRDCHRAATWRVLHGVEDQIIQGATDLVDIEVRRRGGFRDGSGLNCNAFGCGKLTMRIGGIFQKAVEIGFDRFRFAALCHGEKVAQQCVEPANLLQDRL